MFILDENLEERQPPMTPGASATASPEGHARIPVLAHIA